ncbi:MAG TPA: hypothetical protein VKA95_16835 [Nitrososphaeraceae archaeon]|nr:hypothetical protein [Nitrososphaeraceae archaeon]
MTENLPNNKNDIEKNYMDSALGIALYILRCIDKGQSIKEIIQSLNNNEQLVSVWIQYLKANGWLKEDIQRNLLASEDGLLDKYQEEMVHSFYSVYAKFMETTLDYWNYFWSQTLSITNRIAESYAVALSRLVHNTKTASRAAMKQCYRLYHIA